MPDNPKRIIAPANYRLSTALRNLATDVCQVEAVGVRALLLLGARVAGLDLTTVLDDVRKTMGEELTPAVQQQIMSLYQEITASPSQTKRRATDRDNQTIARTESTADHSNEEPSGLGDVGFSFDE